MARAPKPVEPVEDEDLGVRSNPDLVGHDAAAAALEAVARSGRLPHAWLVAGPPGVGKATLAYRFGRWLMGGGPDRAADRGAPLFLPPEEPAFRRIAAGAHADLRALRPSAEGGIKKVIRVDDVRAAIRFLAMTPAEGGWRFLLVDGAETLRLEAANALLKTLEEPPPRSVLMLTTAAPGPAGADHPQPLPPAAARPLSGGRDRAVLPGSAPTCRRPTAPAAREAEGSPGARSRWRRATGWHLRRWW
jgi:DNA polymerase-3 subunit delta'